MNRFKWLKYVGDLLPVPFSVSSCITRGDWVRERNKYCVVLRILSKEILSLPNSLSVNHNYLYTVYVQPKFPEQFASECCSTLKDIAYLVTCNLHCVYIHHLNLLIFKTIRHTTPVISNLFRGRMWNPSKLRDHS